MAQTASAIAVAAPGRPRPTHATIPARAPATVAEPAVGGANPRRLRPGRSADRSHGAIVARAPSSSTASACSDSSRGSFGGRCFGAKLWQRRCGGRPSGSPTGTASLDEQTARLSGRDAIQGCHLRLTTLYVLMRRSCDDAPRERQAVCRGMSGTAYKATPASMLAANNMAPPPSGDKPSHASTACDAMGRSPRS
ncbi:hypothetical protein PHLGIDRAFT_297870 [Phlebiopsis gigantea 11061_1 CR5-6]|uniref:Uncharacterized protein n=1 Tax=Phlebiopsis gigantea (strain 11061_1 CR5-6) TaxID=745531 RepID=A0A0C3S0D2_PHLG1|nr:hypothetical protein PHLGIDRAFT_297870 [Phlebiopsis gigantea 11061_1 CR5-6]